MASIVKSFLFALYVTSFVYQTPVQARINHNEEPSFECYEKLMTGPAGAFSRSSQPHFFYQHEIDDEVKNQSDLQQAKYAISYLGKKLGCSSKDLLLKNKQEHKDECRKFPFTICILQRKIGYFIYTTDYVDGVNIIFNRWD